MDTQSNACPAASASPAVPAGRRWCIRSFVVLLVTAWTVTNTPRPLVPVQRVSAFGTSVLQPLGLSIGPWGMFTPAPRVDNIWLTATIDDASQPPREWATQEWRDAGTAEKFYRFRHMNYEKALAQPVHAAAAEDFAHYLQRTLPQASQRSRLALTANGLRYIPPAEGGIPPRDEITWMLYSETLATIEPEP